MSADEAIRLELEEAPALEWRDGRPGPPFLVRAVQEYNDGAEPFLLVEAFEATDLRDETDPDDDPWVTLDSDVNGEGVSFPIRHIPAVIAVLRQFADRWAREGR
jgi:hypothetical protein